MNLGKKLIDIRKKNNMSQEEFAETFNVSRQTISSWENSKSYPDIDTLVKISNKFDISLDDLLKGDVELVKDFDSKIKKGKKFNFVVIAIILVFISIFFVYVAVVNKEKYLPLKGVICTYENNFITQDFQYVRNGKPVGVGTGTDYGEREEFKKIFIKTTNKDFYKKYDNVDTMIEDVKQLYEETGAVCEIHSYRNYEDANYVEMQKFNEFRNKLIEQNKDTDTSTGEE